MNIEQKAKAYDEKLYIARCLIADPNVSDSDKFYIKELFPEVIESEDERIRKELIEHVKDQQSSFISAPDCRDKYEEEENNKYNSWLAWLEKQGGKETTEWSKEDERLLNNMVIVIQDYYNKEDAQSLISWLKSLKHQNLWKPSDEQIKALKQAKTDACGKPYFNALASLYVNLQEP